MGARAMSFLRPAVMPLQRYVAEVKELTNYTRKINVLLTG